MHIASLSLIGRRFTRSLLALRAWAAALWLSHVMTMTLDMGAGLAAKAVPRDWFEQAPKDGPRDMLPGRSWRATFNRSTSRDRRRSRRVFFIETLLDDPPQAGDRGVDVQKRRVQRRNAQPDVVGTAKVGQHLHLVDQGQVDA